MTSRPRRTNRSEAARYTRRLRPSADDEKRAAGSSSPLTSSSAGGDVVALSAQSLSSVNALLSKRHKRPAVQHNLPQHQRHDDVADSGSVHEPHEDEEKVWEEKEAAGSSGPLFHPIIDAPAQHDDGLVWEEEDAQGS